LSQIIETYAMTQAKKDIKELGEAQRQGRKCPVLENSKW